MATTPRRSSRQGARPTRRPDGTLRGPEAPAEAPVVVGALSRGPLGRVPCLPARAVLREVSQKGDRRRISGSGRARASRQHCRDTPSHPPQASPGVPAGSERICPRGARFSPRIPPPSSTLPCPPAGVVVVAVLLRQSEPRRSRCVCGLHTELNRVIGKRAVSPAGGEGGNWAGYACGCCVESQTRSCGKFRRACEPWSPSCDWEGGSQTSD